jgi:hypothetical protein
MLLQMPSNYLSAVLRKGQAGFTFLRMQRLSLAGHPKAHLPGECGQQPERARLSPVKWLQSEGGSPLPPLFQNRACEFPSTRLLSEVVVVNNT